MSPLLIEERRNGGAGGLQGSFKKEPKDRLLIQSEREVGVQMTKMKSFHTFLFLGLVLGVVAIIGCQPPGGTTPSVISTSPIDTATIVAVNSTITATFSEPMDATTITTTTFTVEDTTASTGVTGVVTYDIVTNTASFAPSVVLIGSSTLYTVTITTGAKSAKGVALVADKVFSFTTTAVGIGPAPVLLGTSGNYVILAKTAVSNSGTSHITGNIGLSPAATSLVTGLALTAITGGALSAQVTGVIYAADMAAPTPANLTAAVLAMQAAYTAASPPATPAGTLNLGGGTLGTTQSPLAAGVYSYTSSPNVSITTNLTLTGAANDVWIFQIPGTLSISNGIHIILTGGAQAKNVFWQVGGGATLGTTSQFQGIILSATAVTINTGASLVGRALAQTAVSTSGNAIIGP